MSNPNPEKFMMNAKYAVITADPLMRYKIDDLYLVWWSKTLQNWKALISTDITNGLYYEVTFNGDKNEAYVDRYEKTDNTLVSFHDPEERVI